MSQTESITVRVRDYTVTLDGDDVSIYQGGQWAGSGKWTGHRVEDCAAALGSDPDETEAIYEEIDDALTDAIYEAMDDLY